MRIIKFRAWHKESKEFLHGETQNIFSWLSDGQPINIMQFTGIKDSYGVDIYEGDIVHIDYVEYSPSPFNIECFTGVVKFIDGSFVVEKNSGIGDFLFQEIALVSVLGNIHQNQELIGVR